MVFCKRDDEDSKLRCGEVDPTLFPVGELAAVGVQMNWSWADPRIPLDSNCDHYGVA
jgi:hypothetical protein